MAISVKCKICGRTADADLFKLDADYKMVVCPMCIKEKKSKIEQKKKQVEEVKPKGWDIEDAYLEKAHRQKQKFLKPEVKQLGDKLLQYKCLKCGYLIKINMLTRTPDACLYCGTIVEKKYCR